MAKRGRKRRKKSTPHMVKAASNISGNHATAEENADAGELECYMAVEVEEVPDDTDIDHKEDDDDDDDDEAHIIDTSWIKEEPIDEELYVDSQGEHNGDVHGMKRKREDEEEGLDEKPKYIKTELEDDYATVDSQELINDDVKVEEEEEENLTDDYWEEDEDDVVQEEERIPVLLLPFQANMQKCAKCAIIFTQGSSKLPSALQNLCKKCKPNVSISCKTCGKHFEHHKLYKRHIRDCSNNHFECVICKDRFPTQRKLVIHKCVEENSLRMLRYICPICSEGFEKPKQRNYHKSLHVTYKSIKCKDCKMSFPDYPSFQEHMDAHSVSRTFICTSCHLSFETRAEFFADQRKHQAKDGIQHEIERPPDFVYACRKCKHWYSDLASFNFHSCAKKKGLIRGDFCQMSNAVPRVLDVVEARETVVNPPPIILARKEPPKQIFYPTKRPLILPKPSPKEAAVTPANTEIQCNALDSAYTCHLCHISFKNSLTLGYHSCLVQHNGFIDEDDDEEDSDETDSNELLQDQSGESNIRIRLTSSVKTLNFSDVMSQAEPYRGSSIPAGSGPSRDQANSKRHAHRCVLCSDIVRHNFKPIIGKWSARYVCPKCMKKAAEEKNCVFKCSKCGQMFPSLSRLNMHLPWHKEGTGEEGVFKEPRLAFKYLPPREELSTPSPSKHSQGVQEVVCPDTHPDGQNNAVPSKEQTAVQKTQPANRGDSDACPSLLSALLKEPVKSHGIQNKNASNSAETGHPEVKGLLRKKLTDKNTCISVPRRIAPKITIANSLVQNQLVINAPLIAQNNLGSVKIVNQGDSLFSQVSQGMFPPIVDSSAKVSAKNTKEPSTDSASTGGTQDNANKEDPNVQEYKGMRVKITKDGPRKTIQVLPSQASSKPAQSQVQPETSTGVLFSPGQSGMSTSIPLGTIACVSAPLKAGNATVPLAFGGNTLKKTNPDGSSSALTRLVDSAVGPGTKLAQLKSSRGEAVNTKPLTISSVQQTGSSTANINLKNIQRAPSAPVLVPLPVDQPSDTLVPRGLFLCYSCNLLFMDIASLKSHGCQIQAFSCHLCTAIFQTPEQLYNHKCLTQTFTCHMCNKKCSSAKELNQHPCIDTNDIRLGQRSNNDGRDNPVGKAPIATVEKAGESSTTSTGEGASHGANNGEMDKNYRSISWKEISKLLDFTCQACGAKFNSKAALYVHKMKHNLRV